MGLVILLLIGLLGILLYSFFPGILPFSKTPPPPAPKPVVKNIEIKKPVTTPAQVKELAQAGVPEKIETKGPQSIPVQVKKFPEQGPIKSSGGISKEISEEVPGPFISPRSTPRIIQRPYSPKPLDTKTRPPSESPGASAGPCHSGRNGLRFRWSDYSTRLFEISKRACFLKPSRLIRNIIRSPLSLGNL